MNSVKHTRRYTYALAALAALAGCLVFAGCSQSEPVAVSPAEPPLALLTVTTVTTPREQRWDGVVEAVSDTTLSAQTSARVEALPVDVGDKVKQGEVLVRFSNVEQESGRRSAQASVGAAHAEYQDAEANWARIRDVFAKGLVSAAQRDAAWARRNTALAALEAARAQLRNASQQANYTTVTAPFDGIITKRFVEVGEAVQSGPPQPQPLLALAAMDQLRVQVVVPQDAANAIRKYRQATLVTDDGSRIDATRVIVYPLADPVTHSFQVRIELPANTPDLYPGMTVKVAFAIGSGTRLLIPLSALVQRGELTGVYLLLKDHRLSLRQLRLGHRYGDQVEVLAGMEDGERIATDPDAAALYLTQQHRPQPLHARE